jgi:transcriptional regulator with XRE-family HTH domain
MSIGERVREIRDERGLSQVAFALELGISNGALQAYEQDSSVPGGKALAALATIGVDINWLLSGKRAALSENRHRTPGGASIPGDDVGGLHMSSPIDTAAMEAVIISVLFEEAGLSPGKLAQIIATLYRDYVASGKIDEEKLRWMVRLAR